jgi:ATP-binding protein involved in chromosome partitioning
MIPEIKDKLARINNPQSGKSLLEEGRWIRMEIQNEMLNLEYQRDGISPEQKKIIETQIIEALSESYPREKISVKTTSTQSQDVYKSLGAQEPSAAKASSQAPAAQIKMGHGTVGNKKPVPGVKKVIAIGSGKGGVGKSTFTANLALSLAHQGHPVGLIDADIYGPSQPMIFGKRDEKPRSNSDKKIVPVDALGIKLMSFGFFINEQDPVIWRGPMLGGVLNQFLFDVDWGQLDYLLIDLPPGTGDIQLSMIQNVVVDGAIIISTPQDIALLDAKKGAEMFKKLHLPMIGMVENMSSFICSDCGKEHFIFGEKGVKAAVEQLEIPFLGQIPLELELRTGSDTGHPYMAQNHFAGREVWKSFLHIADGVETFFGKEIPSPKMGIISKLFNLSKG